ncbi:MAG: GntP family permease, partial [[Actinobacillus] rossii]|nr:GntP family permease [[Actinobacillus] rossii]
MFFSTISPLIWVLIGIFLLIFLIVKVKLHSFVALLISALFIALTEGMPIEKIASTISAGVGGILSALALIVVIGAIIGKLMTESGASQQIADTIVSSMGGKMLPFALLIIGTLFGMAMFYEVAFLIIIPLVLSIAKEANIHYM